MPFLKNIASVYIIRRSVRGKTDILSEETTEPYDGTTQLTLYVYPLPSALKHRRYTIHDSSEGPMVIMIGSSRVEDRDPLSSSRKSNPPEDDMSPAPDLITFTCTMLDGRTQRTCDKAFSCRTNIKSNSFTFPRRENFPECTITRNRYIFKFLVAERGMCVKSTDTVCSYTFCIGTPPHSEIKKLYRYQQQLPGCGICACCPRGFVKQFVTCSYLGLIVCCERDQCVCRWNVSFCLRSQ